MEVALLPLPTSLRAKLFAAGHFTTTTLLFLTPLELAREAQLSNEEALSVLKLVPRSSSSSSSDGIISASSALDGAKTAWDLLEYEKNRKKIVTSCAELDMILEGGFCPKEVTEICGVPGVGKTQLGMQLAINVQIPVKLGGVGGHAIYIDTEGSFMLERALQMTKASIEELVLASSLSSPMDNDLIQQLDIDTYLSHIYLLRVHDPTEQLAVINNLPNLLKEHNQVKLIVIDSITFNFRQDFEDMAGRTRLLAEMGQKLGKIAEEHDLAIVLTNQVTMKPSNNEISRIVPALGESWSHACTNRVMMYWIDTQRYAHVVKSPSLQAATAAYDINEGGICSARNKSNNKSNNNDNKSNNKRLKLDEEAA
ncbi:unnamed protein product, partial [Sphagnum balticum]